jgi:hypothetical protein
MGHELNAPIHALYSGIECKGFKCLAMALNTGFNTCCIPGLLKDRVTTGWRPHKNDRLKRFVSRS